MQFLRVSSNEGHGLCLQAIDDFESHLGEATEKFERNRGKYERVARTKVINTQRLWSLSVTWNHYCVSFRLGVDHLIREAYPTALEA